MATLINREVWHVSGAMVHGIVRKHDLKHIRATIQQEPGFSEVSVHAGQLILTIEEAIHHAEEMADYWQQQAKKWIDEAYRRDVAKPEPTYEQ